MIPTLETWLPVVGFKDYIVSCKGNIKSLKYSKVRQLKASLNTSGYPRVVLTVNGEQFSKEVHRIVAEAFLQNPEKKENS